MEEEKDMKGSLKTLKTNFAIKTTPSESVKTAWSSTVKTMWLKCHIILHMFKDRI